MSNVRGFLREFSQKFEENSLACIDSLEDGCTGFEAAPYAGLSTPSRYVHITYRSKHGSSDFYCNIVNLRYSVGTLKHNTHTHTHTHTQASDWCNCSISLGARKPFDAFPFRCRFTDTTCYTAKRPVTKIIGLGTCYYSHHGRYYSFHQSGA